MILYYIIRVDIFAIALSVFPLLYSYLLAEKGEELKYELNKNFLYFPEKRIMQNVYIICRSMRGSSGRRK